MNVKQDAIRTASAEPDVDAPLSDDEFERGYGAMLARRARAATGLPEDDFAACFGIPIETLHAWEHGKEAPGDPATSYLRVIVQIPDAVARALHDAA